PERNGEERRLLGRRGRQGAPLADVPDARMIPPKMRGDDDAPAVGRLDIPFGEQIESRRLRVNEFRDVILVLVLQKRVDRCKVESHSKALLFVRVEVPSPAF